MLTHEERNYAVLVKKNHDKKEGYITIHEESGQKIS